MPSLSLNDAQFYYELHGQAQPTVVLIAGYGCDHTFWTAVLPLLSKHFQVLLIDNRGAGQTHDDERPLSIEAMADDVMAIIRSLGLPSAHIVGHSMGGTIAQALAVKYANALGKVVIVNSVAKWRATAIAASQAALNLRHDGVNRELIIDTVLPWIVGKDLLANTRMCQQFKHAMLHNPHPQSLNGQSRQLQAIIDFDYRLKATTITAPTLVIASEEDIMATPQECQTLAELIPNAHYLCLPGGHSSAIEHAKSLSQHIIEFLN